MLVYVELPLYKAVYVAPLSFDLNIEPFPEPSPVLTNILPLVSVAISLQIEADVVGKVTYEYVP
jgi:hypothetical protein